MNNLNNIKKLGKDCCGCRSCEQICPKKSIEFEYDNEGFLYPVIDESSCVNCGLCIKHCAILSDVKKSENPEVYASKYNNREETFKSTSGGIFMPLAKKVIENGGIVFGCAFDENLVAGHIGVEDYIVGTCREYAYRKHHHKGVKNVVGIHFKAFCIFHTV